MSQPIFIKGVQLNEQITNILIENKKFVGIGTDIPVPTNAVIVDGNNFAAFPSFANGHTHAAMTLFRGYGDDLPLDIWLNEWIWPKEKNLDPEIIYWGTRLACLEMIKSGTTAFNNMYFFLDDEARAVTDSGIRALLGNTRFGDADLLADINVAPPDWQTERVQYCVAPHAIYTVSELGLKRCADYCKMHNLKYHIHMSETLHEVEDCLKAHGCRPYEYLERLGILEQMGSDFIGAHSLHLSEREIALVGKHHCCVAHNPNSNLKLASGHQFMSQELSDAGAIVTLGTDGCSSSNNLDMLEATKTMSLLQKGWRKEPTSMPCSEALCIATENGFKSMGFDAGRIEVGKLADMMLVDLNNIAFIPNNNSLSNLIYSAHSDAIDTVICNGEIVMEHRKVKDEEEIVLNAKKAAKRLLA